MRKLVLIVVALLSLASVSYAQTSGKISTVWKCAAGTPMTPLPVGDAPDHIYGVQQLKCTAVSGELAGMKQTSGVPTEFVDATGASSKGHGIFVEIDVQRRQDRLQLRIHRHVQEQDDGHRQQQVHGHERHRPIQRHEGRRDL